MNINSAYNVNRLLSRELMTKENDQLSDSVLSWHMCRVLNNLGSVVNG